MQFVKTFQRSKIFPNKGGSPGLVVTGDDSYLKGRGFGCRSHILDGHLDIFSH